MGRRPQQSLLLESHSVWSVAWTDGADLHKIGNLKNKTKHNKMEGSGGGGRVKGMKAF